MCASIQSRRAARDKCEAPGGNRGLYIFAAMRNSRALATLVFRFALPFVLGRVLSAQSGLFVGAMGGVATLSADARAVIAGGSSTAGLYKPENGATAQVFGGIHFNDWISAEGNYVWNRNRLTLTSAAGAAFYQQERDSSQQGLSGDLMVYFRGRASRLRPYLAIGGGFIRFATSERATVVSSPAVVVPPAHFTSTAAAVRFPVGIDVALTRGWRLRYSFTETIRGNPISPRLTPPGQRNLAVYQNLVGLAKYF